MFPLLCALALLLFPVAANRQAVDLAARLEARYRSARTLQATFLERYAENGAVLRSEAGTAYFRRPGRMRWEYDRPEKNLFLLDGKTAWFYVPADHTVTRMPAKQSEDLRTPLALLAGQMKLSRICSHVDLADAVKPLGDADVVLRCTVRGQAAKSANSQDAPGPGEIDAVFFEVTRDTAELARLIVRQPAGIEVEFRFENWRFDPNIPEAMFHFQPPPGVAIVNGESPDARTPGN